MEYKKVDWVSFRNQVEKDSLQKLNSGVTNALNKVDSNTETAQDKLKLVVLTGLVEKLGFNAIITALLNAEFDVTDMLIFEKDLPEFLLRKLKQKGNVVWFLDLAFYTYDQIIKREKGV